MIRRPPRSTPLYSSAASDVYKRQDSGYLPRIAALSDRMMTAIGLNGRAIIPMILGFGCITMATITTRILGNERERKIATALMAFAIPCSAQLGVITGLLAGAGGPRMACLLSTSDAA